VLRNINARFLHDLYRQRVNIPGGLGACALHIQNFTGSGAQKSFGQVTAARIASA